MVGSGLVNSLARPDGNTTGVSILATELDGKRQEILIEAVPGLRRMAVLADSNATGSRSFTDPDREGEAIAWHIAEYARAERRARPPRHVQRDHQGRRPGRLRAPARDRPASWSTPSRRAASSTAWSATSSARCSGRSPRGPLGRPRPVGRRAAGRRPRARDRRLRQPGVLDASPPSCGAPDAGAPLHAPSLSRASTARRLDARHRGATPETHRGALRGGELRRRKVSADRAAAIARRRRSPPARCSRRRRASSASPRKRTMSVAQQLYEGIDVGGEGQVGLITYMRTDSVTSPSGAVAEAREFDRAAGTATDVRARAAATVPHPEQAGAGGARGDPPDRAVARTAGADARRSSTPEQFRLYELIWKRFVASQMASARLRPGRRRHRASATAATRCRATGEARQFVGFLAVYREGARRRGRTRTRQLAAGAHGRASRSTCCSAAARAALHPAAAALHRGHAGQGAGGARHRPALDLRADHRDDPGAWLPLIAGAVAQKNSAYA